MIKDFDFTNFKKAKLNSFELKCLDNALDLDVKFIGFNREEIPDSDIIIYDFYFLKDGLPVFSHDWFNKSSDINFFIFKHMIMDSIDKFNECFFSKDITLQLQYINYSFNKIYHQDMKKFNSLLGASLVNNIIFETYERQLKLGFDSIESFKFTLCNIIDILNREVDKLPKLFKQFPRF